MFVCAGSGPQFSLGYGVSGEKENPYPSFVVLRIGILHYLDALDNRNYPHFVPPGAFCSVVFFVGTGFFHLSENL